MILLEEFVDISVVPPCMLLSVVGVQGSVSELLLKQGTAEIPVSREVTALSMMLFAMGYLGISEDFW